MRLYVGNLSYSTTEETLREAFSNYGEVVSVEIMKDRFTEQSKGFGFVEMENDQMGERGIGGMNGKNVDGRRIRVSEAVDKKDFKKRDFSDGSRDWRDERNDRNFRDEGGYRRERRDHRDFRDNRWRDEDNDRTFRDEGGYRRDFRDGRRDYDRGERDYRDRRDGRSPRDYREYRDERNRRDYRDDSRHWRERPENFDRDYDFRPRAPRREAKSSDFSSKPDEY